MQDVIRLLPDVLVNQIAAGEVVQRPSSVVKELMENSIDAGATKIDLIIRDHGKKLIQVVDNGSGMNESDARMSLERHATSKINSSDDLFNIRTMGFRGEALASIAAVSHLELKSRMEDMEIGTKLVVEGSEVKLQEADACEKGTSIAVKNLFYNVPARRNFLKSDGVEMKHIIDEFQRIALAHSDKSMNLYQEDVETFHLVHGKLSQRIVHLMGKAYKDQLVSCKTETDLIKLGGYVGKPEFSKKTRGEQFLYVNNRFIRSNYLNHAIKMAYEGLIPDDYFPFYVLFLEIDPSHIDINVHPTKTEIKFDDERTIYAILRAAVKQSLGTHNVFPSLDFDADVNLMEDIRKELGKAGSGQGEFAPAPPRDTSAKNWESLYDENLLRRGTHSEEIIRKEEGYEESSLTFESKMQQEPETGTKGSTFLQVQNRFIISNVKSGFILFDQRASLERINYEQLQSRSKRHLNLSQQVLFPVSIDFNQSDFELVMELEPELKTLGFEFEVFGKSSIVINGIPADIETESEKRLFEELIEQYKFSKNDLEVSDREKVIRLLSKRTAANNLRPLSVMEMDELVNKLFSCENPNYTPDGQPTFKIIDTKTIENLFN